MSRVLRSSLFACVAVALLAGLACGRYGPPRRVETVPAAAPPAATAGPSDPAETQPAEPDPEP